MKTSLLSSFALSLLLTGAGFCETGASAQGELAPVKERLEGLLADPFGAAVRVEPVQGGLARAIQPPSIDGRSRLGGLGHRLIGGGPRRLVDAIQHPLGPEVRLGASQKRGGIVLTLKANSPGEFFRALDRLFR